jgi:hypothetical protein
MTGIMQIMAAMQSMPVIIPNTAIYIDANNSSSYSGSGTTINDLSGYNRTQTLSNAAAYTMLNGVKCFDCSGTYIIQTAVSGVTLPTTGFTYIAWARMISSSASWRTLFRTGPADHPLLIQLGSNTLGMYDNTINAFYSAGYDVSSFANVWVQWVVTGNSSGQTFYINGQQVGTTVQTAAGNEHQWLGGVGLPNGQSFGYIANMKLWQTILSQAQIQQEYTNFISQFTLPNIVTSNLVLWYDPSFSTSYSGSGTSITNLANTSLTGTMSNITYASPYFEYNGSTSQVSVPDNALLEPGSGDWTMEAWFRPSVLGSSSVVLGKFDNGGASQDVSYSIRINSSGSLFAQIGSGSGSGSTLFVNSTSYQTVVDTWYQVVYVFKNGATKTLETFINGTSIGTVNHSLSSILNTTNNLYLGSYNGGEYSQWFNGRIGVTRLYSSALTSAQVLQNFNADKSKYGL